MNTNNIYTIVDFPELYKTFGNYSAIKPKKAAEEVFIFLTNQVGDNFKNDSEGKFIVFVIRDIKNNKEYKYIGNKIKLENPIVVYKDGKEIKYNYKNIIGKYSEELDKI
jgi:hypothetical protein